MSAALYINILSIFIVMLVVVIFLAKYEFKQQRIQRIRRILLSRIHHLRLSKKFRRRILLILFESVRHVAIRQSVIAAYVTKNHTKACVFARITKR